MCHHEIIGDFYRGCGHFHGRYYTGEKKDCGNAACKTSRAHKHKSSTVACNCPEVVQEDRKIQNMFQINFPKCERTSR
ncbi:hypothetical protein D9619_008992 [Psilocybe cf. subviscida]|uniref:Uncharacterized protein n=1 Tax=Psilocybe cf. subviscida TaxID=2480587 RepID=A0A8H5BVS8_9AGAR|nr:hypothetical protein D9619_008992 [Psilocybe cf. subviscida]